MAVRISALSVPKFYDEGIEVGAGWVALPKRLEPAMRKALVEYVGRFIQIHSEDVKNLVEYGLELVDGKLAEVTTKKKTGADGAGGKD